MKTCTTCLLDESILDINLNEEGRCQYCVEADIKIPMFTYSDQEVEKNLSGLTSKVKSKGKYDCLIGISGGVDSSYVTYLAHQKLKLNPLVIHFDNGWNSETANRNIQKIVDKAGFDFQTYVIDWPEFRDLQRSFFLADVLDIEMLTDHAIYAAMFKLAKKYGIRHVLSGSNYRTEHGLPGSWSWIKQDFKNIKAIHRLYGSKKLKSFPVMGITKYGMIRAFKLGATFHKPLDLINYKKNEAMDVLKKEYGWEYYGGKHYESVFTKFYQAHYLPTKFGIDKRKAHLSSLIRNGEISRDQALKELEEPLYDPKELSRDLEYVSKKLGFSKDEFEKMIHRPGKKHDDYPSDIGYARKLIKIWRKYFDPIPEKAV